jgi:hypothetical protein
MLTQEDDVEIHALAARGWSVSAIARHSSVRMWVRPLSARFLHVESQMTGTDEPQAHHSEGRRTSASTDRQMQKPDLSPSRTDERRTTRGSNQAWLRRPLGVLWRTLA